MDQVRKPKEATDLGSKLPISTEAQMEVVTQGPSSKDQSSFKQQDEIYSETEERRLPNEVTATEDQVALYSEKPVEKEYKQAVTYVEKISNPRAAVTKPTTALEDTGTRQNQDKGKRHCRGPEEATDNDLHKGERCLVGCDLMRASDEKTQAFNKL